MRQACADATDATGDEEDTDTAEASEAPQGVSEWGEAACQCQVTCVHTRSTLGYRRLVPQDLVVNSIFDKNVHTLQGVLTREESHRSLFVYQVMTSALY